MIASAYPSSVSALHSIAVSLQNSETSYNSMDVADSYDGIPFSSSALRRSVPELKMSAL